MPKRRRFDSKLSRQIDATHLAIDTLRQLPATKARTLRIAALTARLQLLEARIPQ
jgi:hypothetical protein